MANSKECSERFSEASAVHFLGTEWPCIKLIVNEMGAPLRSASHSWAISELGSAALDADADC